MSAVGDGKLQRPYRDSTSSCVTRRMSGRSWDYARARLTLRENVLSRLEAVRSRAVQCIVGSCEAHVSREY